MYEIKNKYEARGSDVVIFINRRDGKNLEALISVEDFNSVDSFKGAWCAKWDPHIEGFYVQMNLRPKNLALHRVITGALNGEVVDHINGATLDNRRSNLRLCTNLENSRNRKPRKNSRSEHKGIYWHKRDKGWICRIVVDGKQKQLGTFENELEAAAVYNREAAIYFGSFARLNKLS